MDDSLLPNNSVNFPLEKHVLVRVLVMTVSFLTMIGSIVVVLSYVCIKSLRSQARQIVLNLSVMDFGIGLANFSGAAINFDKYYFIGRYENVSGTIDGLCKVQAFVALFATFSSVFWTMSLAVYMYLIVFHFFQRSIVLYIPLCYLVCYGLPIALTIWLLFTDRLGNAPYNSSGWCGIILVNPSDNSVDIFAAVFGYDIWIYLTFFLCTVIYSVMFLRINIEFRSAVQLVGITKFWGQALQFLDFKLVLIPLAFFVLRVWSCIVNILFVYCGIQPSSLHHSVNLCLVILSGVGDSGQGLANGLIFVILVKKVRQKLCPFKCLDYKKYEEKMVIGTTTPLLINSSDTDARIHVYGDNLYTPTNSLTQ